MRRNLFLLINNLTGIDIRSIEYSNDTNCKEYNTCTVTYGIGDTWLNNSSISTQIDLGELIGSGRFGQVFKGEWNCQDVAVKIFYPSESESGRFIAIDRIFKNEWLQTWLVFDHHSRGSLHSYLSTHDIKIDELIKIVSSISAGLCYLHLEIIGVDHFKPVMAHRDVKAANILLKNDGNCCISDLGTLLVDHSYVNYINDISTTAQSPNHVTEAREVTKGLLKSNFNMVGTKRYLPPESLSKILVPRSFEVVQKGDVYAFGLLLWEVSRRTLINGLD
ncbi:hypothetical protein MXB_2898 [Myxobolus squamalis]|nr:hypothetical protein MXB_2898 [Myxobolus squamalis]